MSPVAARSGPLGAFRALPGIRVGADAPVAPRRPLEPFPPLHVEILTGIADGLTNREIGERLYRPEETVKDHVSQMLAAWSVSNRVGLVGRGFVFGVLDDSLVGDVVALTRLQARAVAVAGWGWSMARIGAELKRPERYARELLFRAGQRLGGRGRANTVARAVWSGAVSVDDLVPPVLVARGGAA